MYRTKEELKNYYNKNLVYVLTRLESNKITTQKTNVIVYDPFNFNKRIAPAENCDIVIGNSSTKSDLIFDLNKGIINNNGVFSLNRYNTVTIFTYCEIKQFDEVKKLHLESIKNNVKELKKELKEKIKSLETI